MSSNEPHLEDPQSIGNREQPFSLISIVGGKNYKIKTTNEKIGIVFHRSFDSKDSIRSFLISARKNAQPRSYLAIKTYSALVITLDPANLSNEEYQSKSLQKIWNDLGGIDLKMDDHPLDDKVDKIDKLRKIDLDEYKDKENPVEFKGVTTKPSDFMNNDEWLKEEESIVKTEKTEKVRDIFKLPKPYRTKEKYAVVQFISYNTSGELLDEPVVITRGYFQSMTDVEEYKEQYFKEMLKKFPKQFISYLDLVTVKVDTLVTPWYSRNAVKNLQCVKDGSDEKNGQADLFQNGRKKLNAIKDVVDNLDGSKNLEDIKKRFENRLGDVDIEEKLCEKKFDIETTSDDTTDKSNKDTIDVSNNDTNKDNTYKWDEDEKIPAFLLEQQTKHRLFSGKDFFKKQYHK